jgi:hypothetical protein
MATAGAGFGLPVAIALIIGSIIGVGIFNLSGVKNMGSVQLVTTILKFAALLSCRSWACSWSNRSAPRSRR